MNALYGYKDRVVNQMKSGVKGLLKANGVEILKASASFSGLNELRCASEKEGYTLSAEKIIVATGSAPAIPPIEGLSSINYWTSDTLLEDNLTLPQSMIIIGGGVIGVECATILNTLGVEVTILEMQPQLLPNIDSDIVSEFKKTSYKCRSSYKNRSKGFKGRQRQWGGSSNNRQCRRGDSLF